MAVTEQRVEELVFRGKAEGIDQTKAALDGLAAAHGRAGQAAGENARVHETAGRAIRNPTAAFDELRKRLEGSNSAWNALERGLRVVSRASDEGRSDIVALDRAVDDLLRNFQRAVAPKLSPDVDLAPMKAAIGTAKSFDDQTRAMIRGMMKQAEESQEALRGQAKAADELAQRAARFRAELDPLTSAQAKLNAELAEARALRDAGAVSDDEVIRRTQQLNKEYDDTSRRLVSANDNIRLTQDQMKNLGYQTNDLLTMWAMGASPFQIISSQAGQIVQALQDGPGGVIGSLKAIGNGAMAGARMAISALGPVGLAIAGVATAAGAVALAMRKEVPDATKTLQKHDEVLAAISARYEGLEERVARFGERAAEVLGVQAGAVGRDLRQVLEAQRKELELSFIGADGFFGTAKYGTSDTAAIPALPKFEPIRKEVEKFRGTLRAGNPDVDGLRRSLGAMYATAGDDQELRKAIEAVLRMTDAMSKTTGAIRQNEEALRALDPALQRITALSKAYRSAMDDLDALGPSAGTTADRITTAFDEATASAQSYGEAVAAGAKANAAMAELARPAIKAATEAQQRLANLKLAPDQRALAEIRQRADAEIAELRRVNGSAEAISAAERKRDAQTAAAKIEISRAEEARRAGYELDVRAVTARTVAEKAAIEAERVRIDMLAQGHSAAEAAARAEEARTLSLAQAHHALSEASRQRIEGGQAQVAQAEFELTLIGMSAGEVARLTSEYQMMEAAKRAVAEAGGVVDPSEISAIQDQAAAIGRATEALQRLNFERDILFDRQQAMRSPEDQRIAEQLRSMGVDFDSVQGHADAAQLRLNERLHETNDALYEMRDAGKEAFLDLIGSIGSGEDAMKSILRLASDLTKRFVSMGLDKVVGMFSGNGGTASSGGGIGSAIGAAIGAAGSVSSRPAGVSSAVAIPTSRPNYTPQDVATVSGSMMSYASRFNSSVDSRLLKILNTAASRFDMRVEAISGLRPGDSRFHGQGLATDVSIYGANGQKFGNYQNAGDFRVYERFAQEARRVQQEIYPELEKMFRWGGYFSGGKGKYGALDSMHFDLAGNRVGMGGGSWEGGLTASQRRMWPGAQSVGMSEQEYQRVVTKATTAGVRDGVKATAYDYGPYDAGSQGGRVPSAGGNSAGGLQGLLKSPFGQGAMNAFGAFGAGVSGGPLGGAITGGLGAIGMGLGPVGIIAGIGAGILGGFAKNLFNKKEREAAHRQAAAEWEQMLPAWRDYQERMKTGTGPTSGLRDAFAADDQALSDFMRVGGKAWKYGTENSTALHYQVGLDRYAYQDRTKAAFRDSFATTEGGLLSGQGLEGPWAKARDAIRQASETILTFVDDTKISFGEAADEVERAKKAGIEQLRSVLRGSDELTDVQNDILAFEGAAAGLRSELVKLGLESEEVARIVGEDLAVGMKKVRENFEESVRDQIDELDGRGYLAKIRELVDAMAKANADAVRLGADTSLLPVLFAKQAQSIVNGAELTGEAFEELITAFPQLSGVVKAFTGEAEAVGMSLKQISEALQRAAVSNYDTALRERAEAESALRAEYERTVDFVDGVQGFLTDMRLDANYSVLNGRERFEEAQRIFRETLIAANGSGPDKEEAQAKLLEAAQDYRDKANDWLASGEGRREVDEEIAGTLKTTLTRAETELDVARRQASFLQEIATGTKSLTDLLQKFLESDRNVKGSLEELDKNRQWGIRPAANRKNVAEFRAAGLPEYTGNFGPDTWPQIEAWLNTLSFTQRAQAMAIMTANNAIQYDVGGYTGPGGRKDFAGIAHKGEVIWSQDNVRDAGGPARVEAMRKGLVVDPYPNRSRPAMQASGGMVSREELRDVGRKLDRLVDVVGGGFEGSIDATERLGHATEQSAAAARRAASRPSRVG